MNIPTQILDQMIADPSINGQPVDVDKEFGGQCWDLVELFAERCGVPKNPWAITLNSDGSSPAGYAKNAWLYYGNNPNLVNYFDKVPAGQQQKGDITIYDGHGIYTEGHIAISLGGSAVFEENADPDGSPAHVYNNRSSTYLLGALRLKGGNMATEAHSPEQIKDWIDQKAFAVRVEQGLVAAGFDPDAIPDFVAFFKDVKNFKDWGVKMQAAMVAAGFDPNPEDPDAFFKDLAAHKKQSIALEAQQKDKGTVLEDGVYIVQSKS